MDNGKIRLWTPEFIYSWLANFLMGFSFYLLMAILPFYLVKHFHAGETMIGVIMSVYIIAALMTRPFSGYLVDSFSRKPVYLLSYFFFIALFSGYVVAGSVILMIILRFLHGITWGLCATSGNTLAIDIMPASRRGEGLGYFGLSNNLAMAAGPMVGLFLYAQSSFHAIFVVALLTGAVGFIMVALIKAPPKLKIVHEQTVSLDRFILVKGIWTGVNLIMIAISWGMLLSFAAMYGKQMGVKGTGVFFTLLALGIAGSRIFAGKYVDKGQLHEVAIAGIATLGTGFLFFALWPTPWVYMISACIIGIGFGIIFPSFQTNFISLAPHNKRGTANATYLTSFDIGVGIGMLISGKTAETYNLSVAFTLGALFVFVALIFYLKISKPYFDKNRLW